MTVSQIVRGSLDFSTGSLSGLRDLEAGQAPSWSPDGSTLAYVVRMGNTPGSLPRIKLRTSADAVRDIAPDLTSFSAVQWRNDANTVFTTGTGGRGKAGLWSIDLRTGATSLLSEGARQVQVSGDRRRVYFFRGTGVHECVERDVASGAERMLLSYQSSVPAESAQVTKDGSKIYYRLPDPGATQPLRYELWVMEHFLPAPISGSGRK